MTLRKVNARDIIIEASDGADPATWAEIGGLTSVTINRSENEETADTTDFDSGGAYSQDIMQRGATIEMEGQLRKDDTDGTLDPGQSQCETNAAEDKVGTASHATYRFRYPTDTEWTVWEATTTLGEQGGGTNEKATFNATLTRSGLSTSEAVA